MSLDFVRYKPEIETVDPDLDRLLEQIIAQEAKKAYDDFEHGRIVGRAVLMPGALKEAGREPTIVTRRGGLYSRESVTNGPRRRTLC